MQYLVQDTVNTDEVIIVIVTLIALSVGPTLSILEHAGGHAWCGSMKNWLTAFMTRDIHDKVQLTSSLHGIFAFLIYNCFESVKQQQQNSHFYAFQLSNLHKLQCTKLSPKL